MASFDPSIISQIPDFSGNPQEARAKGFKLADLITEQQRDKLLLGEQQQQVQEQRQARDIFKGADISSNEGRVALSQKLSSAGLPKQAMEALQFNAEQQTRELQQKELRLRALDLSSNIIGPAALQVKQVLQTQGLPAAQQLYGQLKGTIPPEFQQNLPPQLPNDPQQAAGMLDQAINISQRARQMLSEQRAEKKDVREEKKLDLAISAGERADRKENIAEAKEADRKREQREGIISDDSAQLAVDRILNGEQARDVLANFGRGKQGPQNIAKVQNLLASTAKERGISSQEISSRMIEFKGLVKEQQVEAGIAGRISYAEKEIQKIGPKVLEVANKIGRGSFVPWNKLQNIAATNISDPNLKQLKAYLNTLTNSYDVLGGRGGTDVEKRAHNRALLDAADSPQALKAAVDAIVQEAQLSGQAAAESMTVDRSALGGRTPTPAAGKKLVYDPATGTFK